MRKWSVASLEDVVDHYARGGRTIALGPNAGDGSRTPYKDARPTGVTVLTQEQFDLIEFPRSLCDSWIVKNENHSNPGLR